MADGQHPRVYYPAEAIETATFKVDESYADEALLEVALLPKDGAKVKPQIFFIGLKKAGKGKGPWWSTTGFRARRRRSRPTG